MNVSECTDCIMGIAKAPHTVGEVLIVNSRDGHC